jgi:hypothetical protein
MPDPKWEGECMLGSSLSDVFQLALVLPFLSSSSVYA